MRQVPESQKSSSPYSDQHRYLIIGNGRVARHVKHYFSLLDIKFSHWWRGSGENLQQMHRPRSTVLLLINDSAIVSFLETHSYLKKDSHVVHFSGSLVDSDIIGAHPLMTFSSELMSLDEYKNIPFVMDKEQQHRQAATFPDLPNKFYFLDSELKPLYHSLCVMAGNFTVLLWQKFFKSLEEKFELPAVIGKPFMEKIFANLNSDQQKALTGPLSRGDIKTIKTNLEALENDPYQKVYKSFVEAFGMEA